jgi:uncharacterized protein YodC (DUF2158 family)
MSDPNEVPRIGTPISREEVAQLTGNAIDFRRGDKVRMKSGGPQMMIETVGDHYGQPTVWCKWYDGKNFREETFSPDSLELVKDEPHQPRRVFRS